MFRKRRFEKISVLIALTLIICSMSAFVPGKNIKADENEVIGQEDSGKEIPDEYELVAHRGLSSEAPENSRPAFEKAVAAGYDHIELDIRRCKEKSDGTADWVVCHDETLERLCGVNKKISDMTLEEIKKYSYKEGSNVSRYPNLKILSLQELIQYMQEVKGNNIKVDWRIELKKMDDDDKPHIEPEVVDALKEAGVDDCVTFISFYFSNLKNAVQNNLHIPVCYLAQVLDNEYLTWAIKLRDEVHANIKYVIFRGTTYTTDEGEMQAALAEGFQLGVYTVDSRVMMGSYYKMNVRSFTTNKVIPNSMSVSLMKHQYSATDFSYSLSKKSYTFTNTRKRPKFTVKYEGEELLEGLCYETSYANNKYPGKATATATGLRNVSGEKDKTFTIKMPKVKGFKLVKNKSTSVKYQWTANTDVTGYKVYRYDYSKKKYKIVKTISKNTTKTFTAKNLPTATKVRYRVKTYVKYNKKTYRSDPCEGKTTYTKPATEKKIKFKRTRKGKVGTVKIGKLARVTGYNFKISTKKDFSIDNRTVTTKKTRAKFKRLKKNKTYYAKARGYLKVGSVKYYGAFSKVVKKKGKK